MQLSNPSKQQAVTESALANVMLARQPIYNHKMGVYAYELLYRSNDRTLDEIGEDNATTQVMLNAFLTMGLEKLVGSRLATINISEWYFYKADTLPVPAEQIILDVPSTITVNADTLVMAKKLRACGFKLALDNFVLKKDLPGLLPYIDILKVDVQKMPQEQLHKFTTQFKRFSNLSLLALKVENLQQYRFYCDVGFDFCQGNLLSKPRVYQATELSSSKVHLMSLLSVLYKPNVDFNEVERIISRDVSVSYKLLNLINSAFFGLPRAVESIQEAVVLLGQNKLRGWISMLALNSLDDCPPSMMEQAVVRAKMCELLAKYAGMPWLDSYFTVGLFSALDVLMKQPLSKLITGLPLSDEIKSAILRREGEMGEALLCVLAYENNDWSKIKYRDLEPDKISKAGCKAFIWTTGLMQVL